jgi:hypothetical protein
MKEKEEIDYADFGKFSYTVAWCAMIILMLASDLSYKPFIVFIAVIEILNRWALREAKVR